MTEFRGSREQRLETAQRQVERLYTDYQEVGKEHVGIDPELQEGIALFLAMGMQTDSSCWGHPERRDDPSALYAERNLFPYVSFEGYQPTDGQNEHGKAIGYSREQVDAACVRMKTDASVLESFLRKFYGQQKHLAHAVELMYTDGMPGARLETHDAEHLATADRKEQDRAIQEARDVWKAFLSFVHDEYFQKEMP